MSLSENLEQIVQLNREIAELISDLSVKIHDICYDDDIDASYVECLQWSTNLSQVLEEFSFVILEILRGETAEFNIEEAVNSSRPEQLNVDEVVADVSDEICNQLVHILNRARQHKLQEPATAVGA